MNLFSELGQSQKKELWATLALRHAKGIGPRRAVRLIASYKSALAAVEAGLASSKNWPERKLLSQQSSSAFKSENWRESAKLEWQSLQDCKAQILPITDPKYPDSLREIIDPPLILYCRGDLSLLNGPSISVVGARTCTPEGIKVSAFFAGGLSKAGVTVISGMAKGIDRAAHISALEGIGKSIAVLGTGIKTVYPLCNTDLFNLLGKEGLLISEFPPDSGAKAAHFPIRNRIISGLSQGVLVIEAAGRSGSLITARLALEQNKDVFAVPGHTMSDLSEGCRELIRRGAKVVFSSDDILQDLAPLLTLEAQKALSKRLVKESAGNTKNKLPNAQDSAKERDYRLPINALKHDQASTVTPQKLLQGSCLPKKSSSSAAGKFVEPARCYPADLSAVQKKILDALGSGQRHIDELCRELELDVNEVSAQLTILEVRKLLNRAPGMFYNLADL